MDTSFLLGARGIELPDPLTIARQGVSLADLATQSQIRQYALRTAQRQDASQQALGQLLPQLQQAGFSDEAVQTALQHPLVQQYPELANTILSNVEARRKSDVEAMKGRATAFKDLAEGKAKAMNDIGSVAYSEAQNPNANSFSRVKSIADFYGVPLPAFSGDPADPAAVSAYFKSLGSNAFAIKDQLTTAETARANKAREAQAAATAAETERYHTGELSAKQQELRLKQQEQDPFGFLGINPSGSYAAPAAGGGAAVPPPILDANLSEADRAKALADYQAQGPVPMPQQAGVPPVATPATPGAMTPGEAIRKDIHGDELLRTLPPPIADQVKALSEGRLAFPSSFALKTPYWQSMLSLVGQYDPSFDAVNYNARAKTRADFVSGKSAQSLNALNTVAGHLSDLSDAAEKLKNFGGILTPLNAPINYMESAFGDPRVKNFNIARKVVADEMTRAYRAAGGSEKDIQEWMSLLNASGSPQQLRDNIAQVAHLLESKINALGAMYEQGMGTTEQPIQLVTPKARAIFDTLESRAGGKSATPGKFEEGKIYKDAQGNRARYMNGDWVPVQ